LQDAGNVFKEGTGELLAGEFRRLSPLGLARPLGMSATGRQARSQNHPDGADEPASHFPTTRMLRRKAARSICSIELSAEFLL
jgi:hypothetical protein